MELLIIIASILRRYEFVLEDPSEPVRTLLTYNVISVVHLQCSLTLWKASSESQSSVSSESRNGILSDDHNIKDLRFYMSYYLVHQVSVSHALELKCSPARALSFISFSRDEVGPWDCLFSEKRDRDYAIDRASQRVEIGETTTRLGLPRRRNTSGVDELEDFPCSQREISCVARGTRCSDTLLFLE